MKEIEAFKAFVFIAQKGWVVIRCWGEGKMNQREETGIFLVPTLSVGLERSKNIPDFLTEASMLSPGEFAERLQALNKFGVTYKNH